MYYLHFKILVFCIILCIISHLCCMFNIIAYVLIRKYIKYSFFSYSKHLTKEGSSFLMGTKIYMENLIFIYGLWFLAYTMFLIKQPNLSGKD